MKKASFILLVLIWLVTFQFGCGFSKNEDPKNSATAATQDAQIGPTDSISSLEITEKDWLVQDVKQGKAQATIKSVKQDKLDYVRKYFRVPRLYPLTIPESNGFELYEVRGYKELESKIFIHPKIYINSGNGQGQVLGYKTGKKDPAGKELVEISVPVALVNGLVSNIPTIGGPQSGQGAAVALSEKYQISNVNALKEKINGKPLDTLPVCPKLFRLIFDGKEYWAKSPFANLSVCPLNQFFRISFEAPVQEMHELLETAAVRDEAVTLVSSLAVSFDVPSKITELRFQPEDFKTSLIAALKNIKPSGKDTVGGSGYAIQDIEQAVLDALFQMAQESSFDAKLSTSILSAVNPLISNYFGQPYACSAGGTCRALLKHHFQRTPVQFSWMETEQIAASLDTESVTALGAVANSSEFIAKPTRDLLNKVRAPQYFRGRKIADIIKECTELESKKFVFVPENDKDSIDYFKEYCRAMATNGAKNETEKEEDDGYYPLGSNTVVYPGAWLKIDIDNISEFTTAKTRTLPDGRVQIESQIVDLIESDPNAKRTQCVEGNATACVEYKKKQIPVRATTGDPMYSDELCKKGEASCECTRPGKPDETPGDEVCTRKQYRVQDVYDYDCKKEDELEYCPYWRNEEDVVDYEIEWDCQNVKVEDKGGFLGIGSYSRYEEQCKEKSRKPVKAFRQRLNCKEDDPAGIATHEKRCLAPKYKCQKWNIACTKYSVNESFHVVHEDVAPKWRPFAIQKGEYPKRFEEDIYLKFVSPTRTVTNCRLNRFAREMRGNSFYIKLPSEQNEGLQPCDEPLWTNENTQALYLPKVYIKNSISYPESRLCGRTEYTFITKEIPIEDHDGLVPPAFSQKTEARIGPIRETCRADNPLRVGSDLWFTEYPPILFSGRVSVLGRVLESVVTQGKQAL